ncbi:hypothetical protein [Pedobacter frigidisoli]|uniref:hypothetical protein n=1 Tax=Pedobacter frigidisoli TaxID=2530455 RepID=UPI0029316147|nr:hypothetical protein [Pedobacter frigidisoli]
MPTINSFIRSANASYKRAARANARQERERAKQHQQLLKEQLKSDNISAVKTYNEYVNMLVSIHKSCAQIINWNNLSCEPEPTKPKKTKKYEELAAVTLHLYKPSLLDKLFGAESKKRTKLKNAIEHAIQKDLSIFNNAVSEYNNEFADWKIVKQIASGVLAKEVTAYKDAIDYFAPFTNIIQLGSQVNFVINQHGLTINLSVSSSEIVPDYVLAITTTGKLSNKKMTNSKFNELYQDYVCSAAIRAAREIFALLPIECVYVNTISDLLDSSTGRIKPQPILSCKFIRDNLSRLNFDQIDCSDAMRNILHNMKFSKNTGFAVIDVL